MKITSDYQLELMDYMGNLERVADVARASFEAKAENYTYKQNHDLVDFLARENHWSPFAHIVLSFRLKVPLFVARQEFKHIVGFVRNERSGRYVRDGVELFIPKVWRSKPCGSIKQGSGGAHPEQERADDIVLCLYEHIMDVYNELVGIGVAPEQARIVLPQGMMTGYVVTGSIWGFARMYKQRIDPNAQAEITDLANQVDEILSSHIDLGELWRVVKNA